MKNEFHSLVSYYHRKFYAILPILIFSTVLIFFSMKDKIHILKNFLYFVQTKPVKNTDGLHEGGRKVYFKIALTLLS